ncbi:MAG TPA: TlpA disulfide reductase family protein [Burkholderiaceae bacterium]|jgi:thiol-disulfide isomerase/thioredoxin
MTKRNKWTLFAVACMFAAIGIYTNLKKTELHQAQSIAVDNLFAASLADTSGLRQNMAQWKGKTLLVNFWATWCNPCIEEIPELSKLQYTAGKKNIQIIGIGIDSATNISEFSSTHKIAYPIYIANTEGVELARRFGNESGGLPFSVLIKPDGQIKKSYLGRLKLEELKRDLELP